MGGWMICVDKPVFCLQDLRVVAECEVDPELARVTEWEPSQWLLTDYNGIMGPMWHIPWQFDVTAWSLTLDSERGRLCDPLAISSGRSSVSNRSCYILNVVLTLRLVNIGVADRRVHCCGYAMTCDGLYVEQWIVEDAQRMDNEVTWCIT